MNILIFIMMLGIGLTCILKRDAWSRDIQRYYVYHAKNFLGINFGWERPWVHTLLKIIIIFAGIVFIIAAYPFAFGPVYIQ